MQSKFHSVDLHVRHAVQSTPRPTLFIFDWTSNMKPDVNIHSTTGSCPPAQPPSTTSRGRCWRVSRNSQEYMAPKISRYIHICIMWRFHRILSARRCHSAESICHVNRSIMGTPLSLAPYLRDLPDGVASSRPAIPYHVPQCSGGRYGFIWIPGDCCREGIESNGKRTGGETERRMCATCSYTDLE